MPSPAINVQGYLSNKVDTCTQKVQFEMNEHTMYVHSSQTVQCIQQQRIEGRTKRRRRRRTSEKEEAEHVEELKTKKG